ncbi:ATP-binding protein [Candidatus Electronema sp. JM]|uniref:ATP-binding protein n=1 Tax=Candidatus Electronema sp. JM TaxID=3401571 RepID=UPI003AA88AFB
MRKGGPDRMLIVDDNPDIHSDIRKILLHSPESAELNALYADILGHEAPAEDLPDLEIDSAFRGEDAVSMVRQARLDRRPYALAYVDMRLQPGMDGLQTIKRIQQEDLQLQLVIITAYSDHSWQEISAVLLSADKLLILKKPFEAIEIRQSAAALIEKWHLTVEHKQAMSALVMQRNMLEEHVREQTSELRHTNELLTKEIKERRRAEEKIRLHRDSLEKQIELRSAEILQQNRFLSTVINSLSHPFAVIDAANWRILAANRAAGCPQGVRACYQYMHGFSSPCPDHGLACPLLLVREQGKAVTVEHVLPDSSGHPQTMELHACPVTDRNGQVTRVIEYCVDITRRKKLEEELIRSRKMETVSMMAGGIAHDFNNLLMAITGSIELAMMKTRHDHRVLDLLRDAATSAAEAKELAHKFLLFSSFSPPARQLISTAGLITAACRSFFEEGGHPEPELQLPDDLLPVYVDPGQIEQTLRELFRNAVEAMAAAGGRVRVSAENICLLGQEAAGRREGEYVRITVRDQGCGIRKEDLPNIFDPYFSGKTRGRIKGMGLGLTIAAAIISQHEGYIEAESTPGGGTAVHIDLPAAQQTD